MVGLSMPRRIHTVEVNVRRFWLSLTTLVAVVAGVVLTTRGIPVAAEPTSLDQAPAAAPVTVPEIPFDSDTGFLKYSSDNNLGEVLGITVNSKGRIVILNHPGSATAGPLYGNASTQLLEFDAAGKFVRE